MILLWWFSLNIVYGEMSTETSVANGLKSVKANVPRYQFPGGTAQLQCDYDLGNDTLYALKWYKDHEEFYRFVPKAVPQINSYETEGVHINISASDNKKVLLYSIDLKSSGNYCCEVSAEAPSFASAQSEAKMEILYLPQDDPVINGIELQYQIGKEINLNCTSGKSHPAFVLYWYINDQLVKKRNALINYPIITHDDGLQQNTLGLRFTLDERHFLDGIIRVKCVASLSPLSSWLGEEKQSAIQSLPIKDMREALLLMKNSAFKSKFLDILLVTVIFANAVFTSLVYYTYKM